MKRLLFVTAVCTICNLAIGQQNVGIGTNNPKSKADVNGNLTIGSGYSGTNAAPANGAIIQGQVGIGTATPNASAALDITSSTKGVSFPNVALMNAADATTIATPKTGLVVYNPGTGGLSPAGLYINEGGTGVNPSPAPNWVRIADASVATGVQSVSGASPLQNTGTAQNPVISLTGVVPVNLGGTGLTAIGAGQMLIGNGSNSYINTTLTPGTGIGITSVAGSVTIANSGVTSVNSGTPLTTNTNSTGAVTVNLTGIVPVANGGTGITASPASSGVYLRSSAANTWAINTGVPWGDITGAPSYITGNQNITLSGDVNGSGTTVITTAIGANKVVYADIQKETNATILGNNSGAAASPSELTLGTGLGFNGANQVINTSPDKTVSITGTGVTVGGSYPNFTLTTVNNGTVTGVTASNGLTSSGGSAPNITLGGTLTAATTIAQAANNFGFTGGSVGIGTATPNNTLEVNGGARVDNLNGGGNRVVYANANGDLNTDANTIAKTDPIYIRGSGLNNATNGVVIIGGTTVVNTASRGLTLVIVTKATHAVVSATNYDCFGSTTASNNLATALNGITNAQIGIMVSYDAWEGQITANLQSAFQRLGLYKALMTTVGGSRRPYAAIFEASSSSSIPSASATEVEHSSDATQPYAEIRGWLMDGSFVATKDQESGLSTPVGAFALAVNESGNVGIGTSSPASLLTVNGKTTTTTFQMTTGGAAGYVLSSDASGNASWNSVAGLGGATGTGTTNYVTKWTGASTLGTGVMYDNGTAVGIGTTNPAQGKLWVQDGDFWLTGNNRMIAFSTDESTDPTPNASIIASQNGINGGSADLIFDTWNGGANVEIMRMRSNGYVGIGTASPGVMLDVNGAISTERNWLYLAGAGDANHAIGNISGDGEQFRYWGFMDMYAAQTGAESRFLPNGNFGIGSTTAAAKLEINNTANQPALSVGDNGVDDGTAYGMVNLTRPADLTRAHLAFIRSGNYVWQMGYVQNTNTLGIFPWNFTAGGVPTMAFSGGSVGIGTASPVSKLQVSAGNTDGIMMGNFNDQLGWNGSGTQPYYAIRFAGFRDVVSNFTGAMIAGVRINLCCSGLSQSSYLSFRTMSGSVSATTGGDGNLVERVEIVDNGIASPNYYGLSDKRLKSNIQPLNYGLNKVMQLKPVSYDQKITKEFRVSENSAEPDFKSFGFIAQEINEIVPEIVYKPENPDAFWAVDYTKLTPILVKAVQEQQAEIDQLKKDASPAAISNGPDNLATKGEVDELRNQNHQLQEQLNAIKLQLEELKSKK